MQVSVEKTSELSRKMTVIVPDAIVQEKMDIRFKKLAREVRVAGFRPGKVPVSVVRKMHGEQVKSEIFGDLIQATCSDALQQQTLVPAGQPQITQAEALDGEGFQYVAEFEVFPNVSLVAVEGLAITRPQSDVTDADVDTMIERLRQQKKTWQAVADRKSQQGDKVTIHFSGVCEGEDFTQGKVENQAVEIGGNQMIPGFEDELKGLAPSESKTFTATFPEGYNNEKLAGKAAEFTVELVSIEQPLLPDVDADFIRAYGVEDGEIATFRSDVRANMERELAQGLKAKLKTAVLDALYESIDITLPQVMIAQEIEALKKPYVEQARQMKLKAENLNLPNDLFESQARRRVALGLILGEVIESSQIKASPDKVRAAINDMAKSYEKPEDVVDWYYADKSRLNEVSSLVMEDEAIAWVVSKARVVDQALSFSEIMDRQSA
ncbi:MAG: trigger factor [Methylomonas sp.]|nr:trigger factor [Methylomonas sp.]PPD19595.1 MAG: trigger factor [Methylomonas sp.]PPD25714.1 MAG: trigger factor [Methylomonas sp.]PPD36925.1 MAG: trigger factor [Methylomonas sp.]PPD38697.1 MAG: trigger factor [Methylomonas sp.]